MSLSLNSLGVNLGIAGAPFSPLVVEALMRSGIKRIEFPLVKQYLGYEAKDRVEDAATQLKRTGVQVWSCHPAFGGEWDISQIDETKRRRAVELTLATLPAAQALGAGLTILHASGEPVLDEHRSARMDQARKSLVEIAPSAARLGIRLAVEFLPRTCLGHTSQELLDLLSDLDPQTVGVCLDVNHSNLRENPPDTVRAVGRRLFSLHISDNDGVDERHWLPGRGIIHWTEFLRALENSGYSGALIYETTPVNGAGLNALNEVRENFIQLLQDLHEQ